MEQQVPASTHTENTIKHSKTALLVIDAQVGVLYDKNSDEYVFNFDSFLKNVSDLLEKAHASDTAIIYIQHDGGVGHSLKAGTPLWEIQPEIAPHAGEPIISKTASDAFYRTTLQQELEQRGITDLVIVGGATEFCIDTNCRRATSEGYNVTLVSDAHVTGDYENIKAPQVIAHHNTILDGFGTPEHSVQVRPTREIQFEAVTSV